jgi:hypothetical protein
MDHASLLVPQSRSKRRVYVTATLIAMAILLPFQHRVWAPYASVCAGYTVLVFGLRRLKLDPRPGLFASVPASGVPKHGLYLCVAVLWIWCLIAIGPHLPYILRTEDTSHPYFGLAFIAVLGLLLLEAAEARSLRQTAREDATNAADKASELKT